MTSGIKVTPEQLQGVAGQLRGGAGSVDEALAQLARAVAPLGSDWAGDAQLRFQQLWEQWQRDARGLHEALTGMAELMTKASGTYASAEQSVATSFGQR
jgi:6 kDa early secretory antigenic target